MTKFFKNVLFVVTFIPSLIWGLQFGILFKMTKGHQDEGALAILLATFLTAVEMFLLGAWIL